MLVVTGLLVSASVALADGITNSGDDLRTGWYPNAEISPQVVITTTSGGQTSETVIAATETHHVYGLEPGNGGTARWNTTLKGTPFNPADLYCADINPSIGTTATPVIDPSTSTVYLTHKAYASGSSASEMTGGSTLVRATATSSRSDLPLPSR